MKKIYMTPETEVMEYITEQMIAASVIGSSEDNEVEIGFNGIDEDGIGLPSLRIEDIVGMPKLPF